MSKKREPQPFDLKIHTRPEAKIQAAIEMYLKARDWFVKSTHGNMYQSGFPDLYCCHEQFGARWIEVKNPGAYKFTRAQYIDFTKMSGFGVKIWILTAATDEEYRKLFAPPNWHHYIPELQVHARVTTKKHDYVPKYSTPGLDGFDKGKKK